MLRYSPDHKSSQKYRGDLKAKIRKFKEKIVSDKILVFCKHGKGRSSSVVISYLCNIGFNYEEALKFVTSKKSDINPLPLLANSIKIALKK